MSRFIGRARELATVESLLDGGARVVSIVGPAGMGKTRLARELASRRGASAFVELAEARSLDDACGLLAFALDVPTPGREVVGNLAQALSGRSGLVVLDNAEHLAGELAIALSRWVAAAQGVSFLVTTRERLRLAEEHVFELPPLAESIELLVEAARRVRPDFQLSEADLPIAAELVRRLDGCPLAIELAASRLSVLSLSQLLQHLASRFRLLSADVADLPDRRRSLERAIDWSWERLEPVQKRALAQASVFRGGFDLAAAEAVIELEKGSAWIIDVLEQLKDRSLLYTRSGESVRFSLFESIADYAASKAKEMGLSDAARRRHAEHYLLRFENASERAQGHGGPAFLESLALELDNLRAIAEGPDDEAAVKAVLALDPLLFIRGTFRQHVELMRSAKSRPGFGSLPEGLQSRLLQALGRALERSGELAEARQTLLEALRLALASKDRAAEGLVRGSIGHLFFNQRRLDEAKRWLDEALFIHREVGNRRLEGAVLSNLGMVQKDGGDWAAARRSFEQALEVHREVGDLRSEAITLTALGNIPHARGELDEARALYEKALSLHRKLKARRSEGIALVNIALILQEQGRLDEAARAFDEALAVHAALGDLHTEAIARTYAGILALERKDHSAAFEMLERARTEHQRTGNRRFEGLSLAYLAALEALAGRLEDGERLRLKAQELLTGDRAFTQVMELLDGLFEVARYRVGARAKEASAPRHLTMARALVADAGVLESDEARIARRIVEAACHLEPAADAGVETVSSADEAALDALVVGPGASWFRAPGQTERQEISNRRVLKTALCSLVDRRVAVPGAALAVSELCEACWPGSKLAPDVLSNRLFVALSSLRKMGLKRVLTKVAEGYLLDPAVKLVRVKER